MSEVPFYKKHWKAMLLAVVILGTAAYFGYVCYGEQKYISLYLIIINVVGFVFYFGRTWLHIETEDDECNIAG